MVEFDEFLSFVSSSSGEQLAAATARTAPLPSSSGRSLPGGLVNPDNKDPLRQVGDLLDTWQHRWPSWEHDRVGVWDDVVRHRALCLERAKGHMGMLAQVGGSDRALWIGVPCSACCGTSDFKEGPLVRSCSGAFGRLFVYCEFLIITFNLLPLPFVH